jgi:hypothetical protein
MNRRRALKFAGIVTASAAGGVALLSAPASATQAGGDLPGGLSLDDAKVLRSEASVPTTANGWPVVAARDIDGMVLSRPVPGTDVTTAIHIGDVEAVLVHVIRRFHYEITALAAGDAKGFSPLARSQVDYETNHASGTAVAILPDHYPRGAAGGFFPSQLTVIRDILNDCEGVVDWGGDRRPVNESLFHIAVPPGDECLAAVADRIHMWNYAPGRGAGVL